MAGHSKFKNIMHRKGAQDKSRAKLFSKLGREISIAVRLGGNDVASNFRLKAAISSAKNANLPKDNIERAIKKGEGNGADSNFEEICYEGYGPGGVAIMVDAMTNNRNRTASEIRSIFSKNGGQLAENGSVSFNFIKVGKIVFNTNVCNEEKIFNLVVENGLIDFVSNKFQYVIYTKLEKFKTMVQVLTDKIGQPNFYEIVRKSKEKFEIELEKKEIIKKLFIELEENEDVQNVFSNLEQDYENLENNLIN